MTDEIIIERIIVGVFAAIVYWVGVFVGSRQ